MSSNAKTTLNRIFLRVMAIGFATMVLVGAILIYQGQQRDEEKWRSDTISKSAALTASYYSRMTTQVILDHQSDIKTLLQKIQTAENLTTARVVTQEALSAEVLRTCKVEATSAYFYEVPTCVESVGGQLKIFHELRSAGFGVGYLLKEIPIPKVGLWGDPVTVRNIALILGCFILLHLIKLYHLKKYIMAPTKLLVNSLKDSHRIDHQKTDYKLVEWHTLAETLQNSLDATATYQQKAKSYEYEAKIGQMASQVAHDIRSPLAALDMATSQLKESPEELRVLIRSAVCRIHDIVNDLSAPKKTVSATPQDKTVEKMSVQLLSSLIESLVSEKRLQFRSRTGLEIDAELGAAAYGLFANIESVEFKRVLSNLINNASESIMGAGKIAIRLFCENERIILQVIDTGKGIPPEILPRLMTRGQTHGKTGGSGLGLYHAKTSIEKWNGTMTLDSTVGIGTTVTISLPRAFAPEWFVPEIKITPDTTVVVIDDDDSIHKIWDGRFETAKNTGSKLAHFSSPTEFIAWHRSNTDHHSDTIILCDHEFLGAKKTGIDVVRECGIQKNAILVTSRFEEDHVRNACAEISVRLLPKNLAGFVPIVVEPTITKVTVQNADETIDAILIDDDDLVHMNWKMAAKRQNKIVRVYAGPEEFWKESTTVSKDTPIYVDSNLADGVKGEDVAWMMEKKGFSNLHLATGYEASQFDEMPWLKGIVGKSPPWN